MSYYVIKGMKIIRKRISAALCAFLLLTCGCEKIENERSSAVPTGEATEEAVVSQEAQSTQAVEPVCATAESSQETLEAQPLEPQPAEPQPVPEEFAVRLREIRDECGIEGISVALFKDKRIIHTANLGLADREREIPADDNTRYRCASVSKLVTGMILMQMYDEGLITPDTLLEEATGLPFGEDVRLWNIMTHTAGFVDSAAYLAAPKSYYTADYVLDNSKSGWKAGEIYSYTNCGAGMMGAVVEKLTGEFFHDYAKSFFDRIGMDAGYVIDRIEDRESAANIYDFDGEVLRVSSWGRTSGYYERFGLGNSYLTAQCELIITASDLARLGIALSGDGSFDGKQVISPEAVQLMNMVWFEAPEYYMGLDVRIYDNIIDGREIHGHPGNALGSICGLYFDPADGTGVAILTNRCSQAVCDNGVYRVIQETLEAAYEYCF